jgi:hypothetical protein
MRYNLPGQIGWYGPVMPGHQLIMECPGILHKNCLHLFLVRAIQPQPVSGLDITLLRAFLSGAQSGYPSAHHNNIQV